MQKSRLLKAPIPGAHLTTNSKNYPWHRPLQYTDFDDAFEAIVDEVFLDDNALSTGMTTVSSGVSALTATQLLLIRRVGDGKISPDMSLLLAGPVYKVFTRILDNANVSYLTGFDTPAEMKAYAEKMGEATPPTTEAGNSLSPEQEKEMKDITEEATTELPTGGLMGAPSMNDGEEA